MPAKQPDTGRRRKYSVTRHYAYDCMAAANAGQPIPTEDEWKDQIRKQFQPDVQKAYSVVIMFHDSDVERDLDNGYIRPKPLHVHIVIHYTQAIDMSLAITRTGATSAENIRAITSKANLTKAYLYLTHSTEQARREKKFEYDVSRVEVYVRDGHSFDYRQARFGNIPDEDKLEAEQAREAQLYYTQQIVDGEMTVEEVHVRGYIQDEKHVDFDDLLWKRHRAGYEADRAEYMKRMSNEYAKPGVNRSLSMIYIQGPTARGKTNLAEALATRWGGDRPFHSVAAQGEGKTFDFAGNYDGQDVTIVNELAPSYRPEEFCNIFDPIHAASVNSRNYDKPWYARYCINTTSMHLEEFLWQIYLPFAKTRIPVGDKELHGDEQWQKHYESVDTVASKISEMRRRWNVWVVLSERYEYTVIPGGRKTKVITVADIHVRTDAVNPNHCYYLPADQSRMRDGILDNDGKMPWIKVNSLPYRDDNDLPALVDAIEAALRQYYELNGYAVTPWNTPRPSFAALREAKDDAASTAVPAGPTPDEIIDDLQASIDDM